MKTQTIENRKYATDAQGSLIPVKNITKIDIKRDELVTTMAAKWLDYNNTLSQFKQEILLDIHNFVADAAKEHDVKIGGKKGNLSLVSYDGEFKVAVSISNTLDFNEQLQIAKQMINDLILSWSKGANGNIVALINSAFEVDGDGNVSTSKIFALLRLKINDDTGKWQEAMELVRNSMTIVASKEYVRLYQRDENGKYQMVPLDIAK